MLYKKIYIFFWATFIISNLLPVKSYAFTDDFLSGFPDMLKKERKKRQKIQIEEPQNYYAGLTPQETLAAYQNSVRKMYHHWDMDVFSTQTKAMFKNRRPVTKGQMKNSAKGFKECGGFKTMQSYDRRYAIIYYNVQSRKCNPYFFILESDGKWRLDMDTMSKAMVMDNKNRWRFRTNYMHHPYMPIFQSFWRIDKNGWPY